MLYLPSSDVATRGSPHIPLISLQALIFENWKIKYFLLYTFFFKLAY